MGTPKALLRDDDGTSWLLRSVGVLREGGCTTVTVVLGAGGEDAAAVLADGPPAAVVHAADWAEGMGASLRCGLTALLDASPEAAPPEAAPPEAALVHLVDLPDVTAAVAARVLGAAAGPRSLARAAYDGRPGHPVLLGRDHWEAIRATARRDRGARDYLATHPPVAVECGDLATGRDVDAR